MLSPARKSSQVTIAPPEPSVASTGYRCAPEARHRALPSRGLQSRAPEELTRCVNTSGAVEGEASPVQARIAPPAPSWIIVGSQPEYVVPEIVTPSAVHSGAPAAL